MAESFGGCALVAGLSSFTEATHSGLERGLRGLVALACLLVRLDPLDLRLNIRH